MTAQRTLQEKWKAQVIELRAAAKALPPGREREEKLRLARQLETASNMGGWLISTSPKTPRDV
jgi:hypothetical protein